MPTYAYRCTACGHEFDKVQKFSDDAISICPECGGEVRRVFQPVGVVFKGSGWYINDSRGKTTPTTPSAVETTKKSDDKSDSNGSSSEKSTPVAATATTTTSDSTSKTAKAAAD